MTFELNKKELENLEAWRKTLPKRKRQGWEPLFTEEFKFTPTGIGNAIIVRRVYNDGLAFEKNITDYGSW